MRDLGFVVHNPVNYYWPPVASFVEILAIMAAIGLMVQRLRTQKEQAEKKYLQQTGSVESRPGASGAAAYPRAGNS